MVPFSWHVTLVFEELLIVAENCCEVVTGMVTVCGEIVMETVPAFPLSRPRRKSFMRPQNDPRGSNLPIFGEFPHFLVLAIS
jgi:hypothetical protein